MFCPENYNTVDATFALIFTVLLSNHKFAGPNRIFLKLTIRGSIMFKANKEIGCNFTNYSVLWGFVTNRIILYGFWKLLTCSTKSSFCKISNIREMCHRSIFTMRSLSHSLLHENTGGWMHIMFKNLGVFFKDISNTSHEIYTTLSVWELCCSGLRRIITWWSVPDVSKDHLQRCGGCKRNN